MGNVVARLLGCRPSFLDEEEQPTTKDEASKRSRRGQKYAYIPDNYTSIQQVTDALRDAGLESSNLILGIDFTRSNEWTGKRSFHDLSLHNISNHRLNPYQQAIAIIGKVLASFDEDDLIPCFGFGDSTTKDQGVFSFRSDHSPCHGFEEVLRCYREIVPRLQLSGPTSFAPIVETAVDIVESSGGQYHVLVIIADGQVSRDPNKEPETIESIVRASAYPLSIVLVGVGDGPWDAMRKFDDRIPARDFDNFQLLSHVRCSSLTSPISWREMQTQRRRKQPLPSLLSWRSPSNTKRRWSSAFSDARQGSPHDACRCLLHCRPPEDRVHQSLSQSSDEETFAQSD